MSVRAIAAFGLSAVLIATRITLRNWGATKGECRAVLPGDEQVADPAVNITRAVTIEAPAATVWPWLAQMGQDKGGMYSYDWLENAVGLDIHNADRIHPEWQDIEVGDLVWLVRPGWLGNETGLGLRVSRIDPGRSLVLFEDPWHAVWSFHVIPMGPDRCRLLSRSRAPMQRGLARLTGELLDPVTFVMTRKMLLGIRERAEREAAVGPPPAPISTGMPA